MGISELIIEGKQFEDFKDQLGTKSINLQKLKEANYKVPNFLAIPSSICQLLFIDEEKLRESAALIAKKLLAKSYAVRSSALIEDQAGGSLAGQFKTELNVKEKDLALAIKSVLKQAHDYLGSLGNFSILIQEFIEPDLAGVLFTRSPDGGREMLVEYFEGRGEELVSGKVKPLSCRFNNAEEIAKLPSAFKFEFDRLKATEKLFKFAQDIEWCIKNDEFYYLQTRPITTISKPQFEAILWLEGMLPKKGDFFYEKNEIAEIAPTPSPLTYSLLKKIYSDGGSISRVYKKYGINYFAEDFLLLIGNEIFVDKEKELKTLLPSYSYLGNNFLKPNFAQWKGFFVTLKNIFALNKISLENKEIFITVQNKLLQKNNLEENFKDVLQDFLNNYELIFEANLLADKALKILTNAIAKEAVNIADLLNAKLSFHQEIEFKFDEEKNIKGNSLEINSEDEFIKTESIKIANSKVDGWWNSLPEWKKTYFKKLISQALDYSKLREYGRWLTVKKVSMIREFVLNEAVKLKFKNPQLIYFTKIKEILKNEIKESECVNRKNKFEAQNKYTFPLRISNKFVNKDAVLKGVSAGIARGKLVSTENLKAGEKNILYTKLLTPDLTNYFPKISGIVSEEGGILSHLAIMARENNIPVLVGFNLQKSKIKLGENIEIDGSKGSIEMLS